MAGRIRIGAVSYLNARPLVFGLEQGLAAERVELSYEVPSQLSDRMAAGELEIGLLPVFELARIPDLEIAPGLGIVTHGPAKSVLLVSRRPLDEVRRVALDPESRTSNALARVLFDRVWGGRPAFDTGPVELAAALADHDAVVRIGDKALFEPLPDGVTAHDLGAVWTRHTGLPFVFAVWACRPGVLDDELYRALHASRREGHKVLEQIAADYTWNGRQYPEIALEYLRSHILFRFGADELRALRLFLDACARLGLVEASPAPRLALKRRAGCDEVAEALRMAAQGRA